MKKSTLFLSIFFLCVVGCQAESESENEVTFDGKADAFDESAPRYNACEEADGFCGDRGECWPSHIPEDALASDCFEGQTCCIASPCWKAYGKCVTGNCTNSDVPAPQLQCGTGATCCTVSPCDEDPDGISWCAPQMEDCGDNEYPDTTLECGGGYTCCTRVNCFSEGGYCDSNCWDDGTFEASQFNNACWDDDICCLYEE
jgi:hypothetical protein